MKKLDTLTKYQLGQRVRCDFGSQPEIGPLSGEGVIDSVRISQSRHMKDNSYRVVYLVEPVELAGTEHNEHIFIPECHTECTPRILGPLFD